MRIEIADGSLVGVRNGTDGVLEAIYHDDGRAVFKNGVFEYQFRIADHLGNTRVMFRDDGNGVAELLQENHYYGFGAEHYGEWNATISPLQKQLYNNKELTADFGLNWYFYGARMFDPLVCRFTGVDPISSQFPHVSTYNYALNNPIRFIDPDGRAAVDAVGQDPIYGKGGKIIGYRVEAGQGPTQIAQDLNTFYGCNFTCELTFTDIVNDNTDAFQNVFDGDGEVNDQYNGDYKAGNIEEGDILSIGGGIAVDEIAKNDEVIEDNKKSVDSLKGVIVGDKQKIQDILNDPLNAPTPGDPGEFSGPLKMVKTSKYRKKGKRDEQQIQQLEKSNDSLRNANESLSKGN